MEMFIGLKELSSCKGTQELQHVGSSIRDHPGAHESVDLGQVLYGWNPRRAPDEDYLGVILCHMPSAVHRMSAASCRFFAFTRESSHWPLVLYFTVITQSRTQQRDAKSTSQLARHCLDFLSHLIMAIATQGGSAVPSTLAELAPPGFPAGLHKGPLTVHLLKFSQLREVPPSGPKELKGHSKGWQCKSPQTSLL